MLSRKEGGVGIVTFNNPERHNAVSLDMWEATKRILDDFAADNDIRVVVLTGAGGKAFVSGADISKFGSERATLEAARAYNAKSDAAYASIADFPKPTIAMIRGYCIGGGLGLATCCDLRICSDNSRFAVPAAKLGLGYGYTGLKRLVDIVGPSFAKEIFYTARQFDAAGSAAPWAWSIAWCRRPSSRAYVKSVTDMICANAPLTIKAVKFTVGEIVKDEIQAQRRAHRRAGRAMLRQPRLYRRPHRLHGKAQAGLHRHLSAPRQCFWLCHRSAHSCPLLVLASGAAGGLFAAIFAYSLSGLASVSLAHTAGGQRSARSSLDLGEAIKMYRATKDIKLPTTITGSLPRPSWYTENLGTRHFLEAMVSRRFREQYEDAVTCYLRDQELAGLDIVTDGDCRISTTMSAARAGPPIRRTT